MGFYVASTLVTLVGWVTIVGIVYLIARRGLIFEMMIRLVPGLLVLSLAVVAWAVHGGGTSIRACLTYCPVGVVAAVSGFFWVARAIGGKISMAAEELKSGGAQIDAAAHQVASSSQSLAQGTTEQAGSLRQLAEHAQELVAEVKENTAAITAVAEIAKSTAKTFDETTHSMDRMQEAVDRIATANGKISQILKMIDDIAFQTNILALNAAVEAARAGDMGLGFAVVADEVRNLAQRCAQAAKDTGSMVEESIAAAVSGKATVSEVVTAVRRVAEKSRETGVLVEKANNVNKMQSERISQVSASIVQLDEVTQSAAAGAEENAAAAEQLSAQSQMIGEITRRLSVIVEG